MKLFEIIHTQIKGFLQAGKTIVPPKSKEELFASRVFAALLLFFVIIFYFFVFRLSIKMPLRIYLRAMLYLIPALGFVVMFYKGVSLSWMFSGFRKYGLFSILLVYIFIVLLLIYIWIFRSFNFTLVGIAGSLLLLAIGSLFSVYYRVEAIKGLTKDGASGQFSQLDLYGQFVFLIRNLASLVFFMFFLGGIWMLLWATGVGDWFFESVLGW
ncbi:MAG: hypothetical protein ISR55_05995 [Bacteroidetes bacterium]|nr:hypothetical protein [Bacteroidota bacterium]MBL6963356.1 hypothetical protein [Bacteroidota bacterium]